MIYKCQNCDGNVIFDPDKESMFCPFCDSVESQEVKTGRGMNFCMNCGGELEPSEYKSALKCAHCGNYIIFEERIEGNYEPHLILPFKISRKAAGEILKKEFGKKVFIPSDFLSEAKLSSMEGTYVPFFMYDFDCNYRYMGQGTKTKVWVSGNREYTETSFYELTRDLDIEFEKLPVDASDIMEDELMDLLEPYDYKALLDFESKYMSGFYAEVYNKEAGEYTERAKKKAGKDADVLLNDTLCGFSRVMPQSKMLTFRKETINYSLLPVWNYMYTYKGKAYEFKLNGQTGKMVGTPPLSVEKLLGYTLTVFGGTSIILGLLNMILGVI